MSNYQNGTIYKICCKDSSITDCYVGSTTNHSKRKSQHKSSCNNENDKKYNYPVYRFIRDNGGWENWEFVLLEDYPCNKKKQLNIRERYWFEKLNATLNSHYPERRPKEYYKDNKEQVLERNKKYYEDNKEQEIERRKKWYKDNKEKILECIRKKYHCDICNVDMTSGNKNRHEKTQKHIRNLEK